MTYAYETTEIEMPGSDGTLELVSPGPEWRLHALESIECFDFDDRGYRVRDRERIFAIWEKVYGRVG